MPATHPPVAGALASAGVARLNGAQANPEPKTISTQIPTPLQQRLQQLDSLLQRHRWLWHPQPFKQPRPDWCKRLPVLTETLLALPEESLPHYAEPQHSLALLFPHLPELAQLDALCAVPAAARQPLQSYPASLSWDIPGRKWQQIEAFVAALDKQDQQPVLEWCGGKGHLGRLISQQHQAKVHTLEYNPALCHEGERLARRSGVHQQFHLSDVLQRDHRTQLRESHAVALHACGELHRHLLRQALHAGSRQLHIAPCCYHLGNHGHYRPFSQSLTLELDNDDLRLAVTETVTAHHREVRLRDQEMAWKLGYVELRRQLLGQDHYQPIRPIDKQWLKLTFADFCRQLATRKQLPLPSHIDWPAIERQGWQRHHEVMRLNLPRQSFRRALESWLLLDMANHLQQHGYQVSLTRFCDPQITPRNLLLSASRPA